MMLFFTNTAKLTEILKEIFAPFFLFPTYSFSFLNVFTAIKKISDEYKDMMRWVIIPKHELLQFQYTVGFVSYCNYFNGISHEMERKIKLLIDWEQNDIWKGTSFLGLAMRKWKLILVCGNILWIFRRI